MNNITEKSPLVSLRKPDVDLENTIGYVDTRLSELMYLAQHEELDEVDAQTLKHHADDLIGVGQKILEIIELRKELTRIK